MRNGPSVRRATGETSLLLGGGIVVLVVVGAFVALAARAPGEVWMPVLVLIGLVVVSVPICFGLARGDTRLRTLLLLSLALKLSFVFVRYGVNEGVYDGNADAGRYHEAGQILYASVLDEGTWSIEGAYLENFGAETRTAGYVAGAVYLVVGPSELGGWLMFSWFAWIGLLCFVKAFRVAFPNAPPYVAAALILFPPSVLYWPSSLGKDALMVLGLGLLTLAMARMLTPSRPLRGLLLAAPAVALVVQIRPHLLVVALIGAGASLLSRSSGEARGMAFAVSRVLLLVALVPALLLGVARMDQAFGEPGDGNVSVTQTLDRTREQTSIGGSSLATRPVSSPVDLPVAVVSVLYRPFLFEASSAPALLSALEGTALLGLTVLGGRWIWRMGPAASRHPFVAYCVAYVLAFVFAFSNVGNAGILARQRVQMIPVLMLAVAAAWEYHRRHLDSGAEPGTEQTGESPAHPPRAPVAEAANVR